MGHRPSRTEDSAADARLQVQVRSLRLPVGDDTFRATLVAPAPALPAAIFVPGWNGTRESDLLDPAATVERIDALAFSGGLSACSGSAGFFVGGSAFVSTGENCSVAPMWLSPSISMSIDASDTSSSPGFAWCNWFLSSSVRCASARITAPQLAQRPAASDVASSSV